MVIASTLAIGAQLKEFDYTKASARERVIGRAKKRDKVHVRGVDPDGEEVMGVAGTGDDVAVFWHNTPATEDALDAIAAMKLAELNQDDSSVVLTCPIGEGVHLDPGDTIPIVKPQLNLDGDYRIMKVIMGRKTMEIEVIRPKRNTEKILEELSKGNSSSYSLTTFLSQLGSGAVECVLNGILVRLPLGLVCSSEIIYSPYLRNFPVIAALSSVEVVDPFVAGLSLELDVSIQS